MVVTLLLHSSMNLSKVLHRPDNKLLIFSTANQTDRDRNKNGDTAGLQDHKAKNIIKNGDEKSKWNGSNFHQ